MDGRGILRVCSKNSLLKVIAQGSTDRNDLLIDLWEWSVISEAGIY